MKHGTRSNTGEVAPVDSVLFTHQHCPDGCDHPQSFVGGDYDVYGNAYCECCWFKLGVVTMLEPCTSAECLVNGIKTGSGEQK